MTAASHGIGIQTTGLHHVAIRTRDLARSRVFYIDRLGFPLLLELPGLIIFGAGGGAIGEDGRDAGQGVRGLQGSGRDRVELYMV